MSRRAIWVPAVLAVCVVGLVVSAIDTERSGPLGAPAEPARIGAPMPAEPAGPAPRLAYAGPRRLSGVDSLRARVGRESGRIVAVTFLLDGQPLGTDTTAPFELDVDASRLPAGRHRLGVAVVDRLGGRTAAKPVRVSITPQEEPATLTATPETFRRVLRELAGGHVIVRLAPGRYVVPHLEVGGSTRLVGSGPGTVLAAATGGWSLMTVRGRGVRVSDLTIDGRGRSERATSASSGSASGTSARPASRCGASTPTSRSRTRRSRATGRAAPGSSSSAPPTRAT